MPMFQVADALASRHPAPAAAAPPRAVDLLVLSDVHLGTPPCRADALLAYLRSVAPREVILNGDILDIRELRRGYWRRSHTAIAQHLLDLTRDGVPISYVTGNHDEALRFVSSFAAGHITLCDTLERTLGGRRTWFVHGDVVERGLRTSAVLRKLGCIGYNALRGVEAPINRARGLLGFAPASLARAAKRLPSARRHIARYEDACAAFAAAHGYDAIVTGHIHVANQREIAVGGRTVSYHNSGDWVDSCSALEHHEGTWRIARG
jgi:UDP-2,3-diacylglucosamine pyrophosphatase LpxH